MAQLPLNIENLVKAMSKELNGRDAASDLNLQSSRASKGNMSMVPPNTIQKLPQNLQKLLGGSNELTLCRYGVSGDGNCLIHAYLAGTSLTFINLTIKTQKNIAKQIRTMLGDVVLSLPAAEQKERAKAGCQWNQVTVKRRETIVDAYINFLQHTNAHMGYPELALLEIACGVRAGVVTPHPTTGLFVQCEDSNLPSRFGVLLLNIDGIHFETICAEDATEFQFQFNKDQSPFKEFLVLKRNQCSQVKKNGSKEVRRDKESDDEVDDSEEDKEAKGEDGERLRLQGTKWPENFKQLSKVIQTAAHGLGIVFVQVPLTALQLIASAPNKEDATILDIGRSKNGQAYGEYLREVNRILRDDVPRQHMCQVKMGGQWEYPTGEDWVELNTAQGEHTYKDVSMVLAMQTSGSTFRCVAFLTYRTADDNSQFYKADKDTGCIKKYVDFAKQARTNVPAETLNTWQKEGRLLDIPLLCSSRNEPSRARVKTVRMLLLHTIAKQFTRTMARKQKYLGVEMDCSGVKKDRKSAYTFPAQSIAESFGFSLRALSFPTCVTPAAKKAQTDIYKVHSKNASSKMYVLTDDAGEGHTVFDKLVQELSTIENVGAVGRLCPPQTKTKVPACW